MAGTLENVKSIAHWAVSVHATETPKLTVFILFVPAKSAETVQLGPTATSLSSGTSYAISITSTGFKMEFSLFFKKSLATIGTSR